MSARVKFVAPALALVFAACASESIDAPLCAQCTISIEQETILGNDFGEPGSQGSHLALAAGPGHTVLAVYNGTGDEIVVHDSTGGIVRRIGRAGAGPGELRAVQALAVSGDTVFASDRVAGRLSWFNATTGEYIDAVPMAIGPYRLLRTGDGFIANANLGTSAAIGLPLHTVGPDGRVVRSFGGDPPLPGGEQSVPLFRVLARGTADTFWTAAQHEYALVLYSAAGERVRTIRRDVPWFPPGPGYPVVHPDSTPAARLAGVYQNGDTLLVTIVVPDADWRDGIEPYTGEFGRPGYRVSKPDTYFDTIIEVLDARTGELIASTQLDEAYGSFLADGRLVRVSFDSDGRTYIALSRVTIDR